MGARGSRKIAKDDKLKALAAKYPLVLLHSQKKYARGGQYEQSAYSFTHESFDLKKHQNDVQIVWGNGGAKNRIKTNMLGSHQHLIVDLGKVDFEENPEFRRISIDHPGLGATAFASEGHVYLERVQNTHGNNFYVVFQVVTVDADGRYVAFLWRRLPGGKIVK